MKRTEDEIDVEIAQACISEIDANPETILKGRDLDEKLKEWLSEGQSAIQTDKE